MRDFIGSHSFLICPTKNKPTLICLPSIKCHLPSRIILKVHQPNGIRKISTPAIEKMDGSMINTKDSNLHSMVIFLKKRQFNQIITFLFKNLKETWLRSNRLITILLEHSLEIKECLLEAQNTSCNFKVIIRRIIILAYTKVKVLPKSKVMKIGKTIIIFNQKMKKMLYNPKQQAKIIISKKNLAHLINLGGKFAELLKDTMIDLYMLIQILRNKFKGISYLNDTFSFCILVLQEIVKVPRKSPFN